MHRLPMLACWCFVLWRLVDLFGVEGIVSAARGHGAQGDPATGADLDPHETAARGTLYTRRYTGRGAAP